MSVGSFKEWLSSLGRPYPARDWMLVLSACALILLALLAWAGPLFFSIESGSAYVVGEPSPERSVKMTRSDVQNVLDTYTARSVNYAAHNIAMPHVVDPAPPASLNSGVKQ